MDLSRYKNLPTEQRNSRSSRLDELSALSIVRLMNREDAEVLKAIRIAAPAIAQASDLLVAAWKQGGRLFLVGAGTSGRLAVLEAAECPPTFNTAPEQIQAIMAGGPKAVFQSQEGSEDSGIDARRAIESHVRKGDVVLGIAASGITPFVHVALQAAKKKGAVPLLLTCNPALKNSPIARVVIALATGPEVVAGSTRLKAGTACKMALNMITVASMVRLGKTYGNQMVDLQPKSLKLVARRLRLVAEIGRVSSIQANRFLKLSGGHTKTAIVMARLKCTVAEARARLETANNFLRHVIGD